MPRSIALKCTYNDGGINNDNSIGFAGTCSIINIRNNIEKHAWCGNQRCQCFRFINNHGPDPIDPCEESILFRDWRFSSGYAYKENGNIPPYDENGRRPLHIAHTAIGKIAILTTRFPGTKERDRRIIGFFEIDLITGNNKRETTRVHWVNGTRIRLSRDMANQLFFWTYYRNANEQYGERWGHLLHRYLEDDTVHRILYDIAANIGDLAQHN